MRGLILHFLQTLKLMLESTNMETEVKEKSNKYIARYVSQLALSKSKDREEFISIRRGSFLLLIFLPTLQMQIMHCMLTQAAFNRY